MQLCTLAHKSSGVQDNNSRRLFPLVGGRKAPFAWHPLPARRKKRHTYNMSLDMSHRMSQERENNEGSPVPVQF